MGSLTDAFKALRLWQIAVLVAVVVATGGVTYGAYWLVAGVDNTGVGTDQLLIPIQRGDLVNGVSINGSLVYANRETLRFSKQGTIEDLLVEEGERVSEGQELARLDVETIANLEKDVAQARINVRDAEDALEEARNPYTAREIAKAESDVVNAKLSLSNAEDALDSLLNPTAQQLTQARLAVLNATSSFATAEEARDLLTAPPAELDLVIAQSAVSNAQAALESAIEARDRLTTTSELDIAQAKSAVSNAQASLESAEEARDTLTTVSDLDMARAQSAVSSAKAALESALESRDKLSSPSALDIANAEATVANAKTSLQNAEEALARLGNPTSLDIARAEAAVANAELSLESAQEDYDTAIGPPDPDDIAEAEALVASASTALENTRVDFQLTQRDWNENVRSAQDTLESAREAYHEVFVRWLGIKIESTDVSPEDILSSLNIDLDALFDRKAQSQQSFSFIRDAGIDDPETPWNEVVLYTWLALFPGRIVASCEDEVVVSEGFCVREEMDEAWQAVLDSSDNLDTVQSSAAKAITRDSDAVTSAEATLAMRQESLDDLKAESDPLVIKSKKQALAVAQATLDSAREDLATLKAGTDPIELDSLQRQVTLAQANLDKAKEDLATLQAGADPLEIEIADQQVTLAQANLDKAKEDLATLQAGADPLQLEIQDRQVALAKANLDKAKEDLATLQAGADPLEIEIADRQVALAKANLDKAKEDLADLQAGADSLQLDIDNEQVTLASANFDKALEDLATLSNDADPLEVQVKEAQVELARETLAEAEDALAEFHNVDELQIALREADVKSARKALDAATVALEGATIRAPWSGIVASVNADVGQQVNANTNILEIVDPTVVDVDGIVDEIDVLYLQQGAKALVTLEALQDKTLEGTVSEIATTARTQSGVVSYPISIRVTPPEDVELPEGLSAVAEVIIREAKDGLLLPIQALYGTYQEPTVRVKVDGGIEERPVSLGISDDFWVVVEDGLSEGELVAMEAREVSTSRFDMRTIRGIAGSRLPGQTFRGAIRVGGGKK